MKLNISRIIYNVIALQAIGAHAVATSAVTVEPVVPARNMALLEAECGDLGVMPVPEGEDPSKYRHCLRHPAGHDRAPTGTSDLASVGSDVQGNATLEDSPANGLEERSCWKGASYGCSYSGNGGSRYYCWQRCGSDYNAGNWCWLAADGGKGSWLTCTIDAQCDDRYLDHVGCGGACSC